MAFDPITAVFEIGGKLIDKLLPDPGAKLAAQQELLRMQQTGELAVLAAETEIAKGQMAINQVEASSQDKFTSRARPAAMWVCVIGFAYHCILQPSVTFLLACFHYSVVLPTFNTTMMDNMLYGLLGLGTMRSVEYVKGVIKK